MSQPDPDDVRSAGYRRARARRLRRESTFPERSLWYLLRDRRLSSLKFRRQHPIGPYFVDFYCAAYRLVIEVDGRTHDDRADQDISRQRDLESRGLVVHRVGNDEVLDDPESVVLGILKAVGIDPDLDPVFIQPPPRSPTRGGEGRSPSPSPRSRGEGRGEGSRRSP
ncbi:endonuclease domain-containing protein [Tautonia plasticadhaerens]|uniref:DUF559 domain-containing protein n=1 Tax=Tautonia plasticadhaerens TaxID=2527974 RepID=A0A518HCF9_9BACT|nr:DUF559 domain-containing protein [Tautonia plasticadhaerens]QDV38527.1 hypothetical protein ElP_64820 [Tautonia plasticadhaerens]